MEAVGGLFLLSGICLFFGAMIGAGASDAFFAFLQRRRELVHAERMEVMRAHEARERRVFDDARWTVTTKEKP